MKKISCLLLAVVILLSMAACQDPSDGTTSSTDDSTQSVQGGTENKKPDQEVMYAVSISQSAEPTHAEDGKLIFTYTYQNMRLTLPDQTAADKVIMDFFNRVDAFRTTANTTLEAAKKADHSSVNWIPYLCNTTYSPMRIDSNVLSLTGSNITYSGSAHPERVSVSANYDLTTGDVLTLGSIMTPQAEAQNFCQLVLEVLEQSKSELHLYDGYDAAVKQRFNREVSDDQAWYFTQNGLCFYFEPYEIAPYSSGLIVAEIPYNKLSGLLNDRYFPAERIAVGGELQITNEKPANTSGFTQIAEIVLDSNGQTIFLHTKGLLWDVAVAVGSWDSAGTAFTASYTALLSHTLSPGDAIMLQHIFDDPAVSVRVTYSNGKTDEVFYLKKNETDGSIILSK